MTKILRLHHDPNPAPELVRVPMSAIIAVERLDVIAGDIEDVADDVGTGALTPRRGRRLLRALASELRTLAAPTVIT